MLAVCTQVLAPEDSNHTLELLEQAWLSSPAIHVEHHADKCNHSLRSQANEDLNFLKFEQSGSASIGYVEDVIRVIEVHRKASLASGPPVRWARPEHGRADSRFKERVVAILVAKKATSTAGFAQMPAMAVEWLLRCLNYMTVLPAVAADVEWRYHHTLDQGPALPPVAAPP